MVGFLLVPMSLVYRSAVFESSMLHPAHRNLRLAISTRSLFPGTICHKSPLGRKANIREPNHAVLDFFKSWGGASTEAKQDEEEK